jgi:hypothetical protein
VTFAKPPCFPLLEELITQKGRRGQICVVLELPRRHPRRESDAIADCIFGRFGAGLGAPPLRARFVRMVPGQRRGFPRSLSSAARSKPAAWPMAGSIPPCFRGHCQHLPAPSATASETLHGRMGPSWTSQALCALQLARLTLSGGTPRGSSRGHSGGVSEDEKRLRTGSPPGAPGSTLRRSPPRSRASPTTRGARPRRPPGPRLRPGGSQAPVRHHRGSNKLCLMLSTRSSAPSTTPPPDADRARL